MDDRPARSPAATAAKRYLRHYPLSSPARMAAQRSAQFIRGAAERHFHGSLLDIGCGSKWKRDLVGDLVDQYVGLDHEGSLHNRRAVDLVGTAYEIPREDAAFDCVLCTPVLEHLERPDAALREALRVLRPGGAAIYTAPMFWHLHEQPRDFFRYTRFAIEFLFEQAGFELVELTPMSGYWLTAATELSYYAMRVSPTPLRPLVRAAVALNNLVTPRIDLIETRLHPATHDWTWMHLVVARRRADHAALGSE